MASLVSEGSSTVVMPETLWDLRVKGAWDVLFTCRGAVGADDMITLSWSLTTLRDGPGAVTYGVDRLTVTTRNQITALVAFMEPALTEWIV